LVVVVVVVVVVVIRLPFVLVLEFKLQGNVSP
jgi:hypothetical protein